MNPETFLQYITRKTGMGRTGWFMAILIHAIAVLYVFYTVANYPERGWWVPLAFAVGIAAIVWGGTYGNYRLDRARNSKPPNQNHYDDVCEGCDPVRMKDGGPIMNTSWWYAAVNGLTREDAEDKIVNMRHSKFMQTIDAHRAYRHLLCEVAVLKHVSFNIALPFNRITRVQISTLPAIL